MPILAWANAPNGAIANLNSSRDRTKTMPVMRHTQKGIAMRNERIRLIAEIGLTVALSIALNAAFTLITPIRMPFGGSFSLMMLPIILLALMRGPLAGITAGVLVGFSDLMFNPYVISIPQMFLDYPIAYGLVGLAGLFAVRQERSLFNSPKYMDSIVRLMAFAVIGTIVGGLARLAAHILSGVLFFAQYAPEAQNVWIYSTVYNLTFMGPNILAVAVCAAVAFPLIRRVIIAQQT